MRKPPQKPTSLRPQGTGITLPKPTLIIDSMKQKPYTFKPFRKWFAVIGRRKLPAGDYSIDGMEDKLAVVAIVIAKGWSKREFMERISFLVCYRMDVGWRVSAPCRSRGPRNRFMTSPPGESGKVSVRKRECQITASVFP